MINKYIDKLEDLENYEWEYKGIRFNFGGFDVNNETLQLQSKNFLSSVTGEKVSRFEFFISKYNLDNLEFYGLKVILNEKPKLTRKERFFLECIYEDVYITRDLDGILAGWSEKPEPRSSFGYWQTDEEDYRILNLSDRIFNFITWESGKAWSKTELMKLEVVD